MTTWESIDNENMENVTVTSDAAFERVSSDEHFEDERGEWFLKQNTSWLVQEVPNIWFLDIADTMLESKKTLYNRKNWNIVVGKAWRSIEAQPQDLARLVSDVYTYTWTDNGYIIPFDNIEIPSGEDEMNIKTFDFENNGVKILIPWVYRVSYWWQVYPWHTIGFRVWLDKNGTYITSDDYENVNFETDWWWLMSWWRSISISCKANDVLSLFVYSRWDYPDVLLGYGDNRLTYLEVQYIQQTL